MAAEVVNRKQTAGGVTPTLSITKATAGNWLVAFIAQNVTTTPTGKDNSGTAGWSVQSEHAIFASSGSSLYVAIKEAIGTETELNPSGSVTGISYYEISGLGSGMTVDVIKALSNNIGTITSNLAFITTTDAGDIILGAVAVNGSTGTVGAWTGSPTMSLTAETATRVIGGVVIPGEVLTFSNTAHWETSRPNGSVVMALKPAAAGGKLAMLL